MRLLAPVDAKFIAVHMHTPTVSLEDPSSILSDCHVGNAAVATSAMWYNPMRPVAATRSAVVPKFGRTAAGRTLQPRSLSAVADWGYHPALVAQPLEPQDSAR